jgi:hypothetical protein
MNKLFLIATFLFLISNSNAQLVEVQANYNGVGDVDFVAYNNTPAPVFLNVDFADLENTTFNEPLPYMKMLEPGFNTLFTLHRYPDADVPRFNYQIKTFKSDPMALADLDFPYLIPVRPEKEVSVFDVKNLTGFWGTSLPDSWNATGFKAVTGEPVFASRTGIIVEIVGAQRTGEPQTWYHTWNNSITVLQPDGTLVCYRNVIDTSKKLKVNEKIFAGQQLGVVAPGSSEIIVLIFQHSLNSTDLRFVIPQFVTGDNETGILLSSQKYDVVHPPEIIQLEMSRKERRKNFK